MNFVKTSQAEGLNIAVIGSGIAGMSAAWLLSTKHNVTLYEQEKRIGGHSHTVDVTKNKENQPVDSGFIVYNEQNYPNLVALFDYLGVETQPSDMTFSVSIDQGSFEFGSTDLGSVFGQRSNVIKPHFWKMLNDIRRFFREAQEFLNQNQTNHLLTLGDFLERGGYSKIFIEKFILPMGAAIWSTKADEMRAQPASTFIRFFASHGLLRFKNQIPWRTVVGGSREYIKKLTANYADRVNLGRGVKSVTRNLEGVLITDHNDNVEIFDHVVIATHGDQALKMLADPDPLEKELLGHFHYTKNRVLLHSDSTLMPKRKNVWSSWNFMGQTDQGVSVTYWMNRLQSLENKNPLFVTVNPKIEPREDLLHRSFEYEHPFFDIDAWVAQQELWNLQGQRNTWFCGSYFGYGFHEDALQSGLAVAEELGGVKRPWSLKEASGRIYCHPREKKLAAE